jgi:SagB-type dehydrogenase family enzyme
VNALHYHQATKHHFNRFARSLGYLDWATQPDPFRRYAGTPVIPLSRAIVAGERRYDSLYEPSGSSEPPSLAKRATASLAETRGEGGRTGPTFPFDEQAIAEFLRCSMGLSAWKQYRQSRWALRVNPSSGNLHPTEAYLLRQGDVYHYAPREHALEHRARLDRTAWEGFAGQRDGFLVALTSILWREAWKYGERAFRYCQHDTGHALAAMRLAASMLGWTLTILPRWSDSNVSTLLGLDRDSDFGEAEREEPELVAVVTNGDVAPWVSSDPSPLVDAARNAPWSGRANVLSPDHVPWPIIDQVAEATRYPGFALSIPNGRFPTANHSQLPILNSQDVLAREVILKRRSAVAFDAQSGLARDSFFSMLARLRPGAPPWDAIDWPPHVHLVLFIHRVEGMMPGVYAYLRDGAVLEEWRAAMRPEFLWENVTNVPNDTNDPNGLFLLFPSDVTWTANRVSCDQEIAADGFFSLGMIARLESSLRDRGQWFYRRLFWECGMIGQVLYLEAEAATARGTGIGCFYDDAVHELLALSDDQWQSLYHFSMGVPVDDPRLTTEPGYAWENGVGSDFSRQVTKNQS